METEFQDNKLYILTVRDYLLALSHDYDTRSIRISRSWGDEPHEVWLGLEHGRIPIENEDIQAALTFLYARRFGGIWLLNNHISFQRWANLDQGRGALYIFDGTEPLVCAQTIIVILEPLSEPGWYYFVFR